MSDVEQAKKSTKEHGYEQKRPEGCRSIIVFMLLVLAAFLGLAWRCFQLQYLRGDHYHSVCIEQQRSLRPQKPRRGVILDCRGRVLAASNRIRIVFAEPRLISDPKATSNELAPILNMGAHKICQAITDSTNPGYAKIKTDVSAEQSRAASKIYGIGVQYDWQRYYPTGRLAAHAVGFTSEDNRGLGGIEFQYDEELTGSPGQSTFFADVHRRPICLKERRSKVTHGKGLILTMDAAIQQFARAELLRQYENYEAEAAVAVVAEPGTGAILAMVSLPDFDPGNIRNAEPTTFRNRAITDQYEPGSIIKPIVASVALDTDTVSKQQTIFCENGNYHGDGFGRIGEYRRGFGDLTLREILVNSSNIGMAKIGQRLGRKKLYDGLRLFGFGKETGIDLPGEATGRLRPVGRWTGYSVTRIPFGQEISVTAIQLVQAFCILANGGHLVRPYLIRAVVDNDGTMHKARNCAPPIGYIVMPDVARWIVTEALVGVVNEGTGRRAKLENWQVFGKTGTAQLARTDGRGYAEDAYVASFVAGGPARDPKAIVLVSIRKPKVSLGKGYTGGTVAAPVAAAILKKTLNYLEGPYFRTKRREQLACRHQ
jgi:cell division protein FtsI/penicillin-binding protein 2